MAGGTGLGILGWCLWSLGLPLVSISCLLQSESICGTEEKVDLPAPFSYQRRKLLLRSFSANLAWYHVSQVLSISQLLQLLLNKQPNIISVTHSNTRLLLSHQPGQLFYESPLWGSGYPWRIPPWQTLLRGKPWLGIGAFFLLPSSKSNITESGKDTFLGGHGAGVNIWWKVMWSATKCVDLGKLLDHGLRLPSRKLKDIYPIFSMYGGLLSRKKKCKWFLSIDR